MGLVANDGAHGWSPGRADFSDPRGGDRVLRAALSSMPHAASGLFFALTADMLHDDDAMLDGDSGHQFAFAAMLGRGKAHSAGVYVVRRHQETIDGRATDVWVADVTARTSWRDGDLRMAAEAEVVVVSGQTELGPTPEFPEHDVLSFGAAARFTAGGKHLGGVLDVLFASGDGNPDDATQRAFKADRNFSTGLLLFRRVIAAQTARAVKTASDPELVGVPADDVERFATRGRASNTLAVFPKIGVRPVAGLDVYAGPLFALAVEPQIDPLRTRLAGGAARNALDRDPGPVLGTEFDIGVRYQTELEDSLRLSGGFEGGMLMTGAALARTNDTSSGPVLGGRVMLKVQF
jgi:hypothetical protein